MKAYIISYDKSDDNYTNLYKAIKAYDWCHCLESAWLVISNSSAGEICGHLQPHLQDDDDKLLVIEVTNAAWSSWGLDKECTDWLNKHVRKYR